MEHFLIFYAPIVVVVASIAAAFVVAVKTAE
ncbi:cytochrome bd oxidase small subunit CydS [Caryophanon latum]